MKECNLCPRQCGIDRNKSGSGFCGETSTVTISRADLHLWEEPSVSGTRGSGTIFFCGCNLRCVFCQNKIISQGGGIRQTLSEDELSALMLKLQDAGAHNINLVTPTHFADTIAKVLERTRHTLQIPVVYNSSAYESVDVLKMLDGLIDVYLPDFKYSSSELSDKYSHAPDYPTIAEKAISEMFRQVGKVSFDHNGLIKKGMIVRHLVLPSCRRDSIKVLDTIARILPINDIKLSLMSQYTPDFALDCEFKNLHRRLTTFEYDSVLKHAEALGFDGYFQYITSSSRQYTPNFNSNGGIK